MTWYTDLILGHVKLALNLVLVLIRWQFQIRFRAMLAFEFYGVDLS
jgi:hypothetical protein